MYRLEIELLKIVDKVMIQIVHFMIKIIGHKFRINWIVEKLCFKIIMMVPCKRTILLILYNINPKINSKISLFDNNSILLKIVR
jgi:hypothetical protein